MPHKSNPATARDRVGKMARNRFSNRGRKRPRARSKNEAHVEEAARRDDD